MYIHTYYWALFQSGESCGKIVLVDHTVLILHGAPENLLDSFRTQAHTLVILRNGVPNLGSHK